MTPKISLLIPTFNAGPEFPLNLRAMQEQEIDGALEILVIDSGSTDGTAEFLRSQPVRLIEISQCEFNHGLTRNLGIQQARGDLVVLTVQDARPADRFWLQRLVDCFEDPEVAGAYSGQLPRPDANPFIKERLRRWVATQTEPRRQHLGSAAELASLPPLERLQRVAFDNVSSCVRRRVALEIPFRRRRFGEDLDWGYRTVLAGYALVFEPRSKVVHSHNRSIWYEFKRVYVDHQNLHELLGVHTVPTRRDLLQATRAASRDLRQVVREDPVLSPLGRLVWTFKALPYAASQNLAQYLGARSVCELRSGRALYRVLDRLLQRGV